MARHHETAGNQGRAARTSPRRQRAHVVLILSWLPARPLGARCQPWPTKARFSNAVAAVECRRPHPNVRDNRQRPTPGDRGHLRPGSVGRPYRIVSGGELRRCQEARRISRAPRLSHTSWLGPILRAAERDRCAEWPASLASLVLALKSHSHAGEEADHRGAGEHDREDHETIRPPLPKRRPERGAKLPADRGPERETSSAALFGPQPTDDLRVDCAADRLTDGRASGMTHSRRRASPTTSHRCALGAFACLERRPRCPQPTDPCGQGGRGTHCGYHVG
jgi:hypothetical protein